MSSAIRSLLVLGGVLILGGGLLAQGGKRALSPEDQKRYDELMESAREHHSRGILAAQLSVALVGVMFLCGAYSTWRKGFKITANTRLEGRAAQVVAALLALLGIGIAVGGYFYFANFGPLG